MSSKTQFREALKHERQNTTVAKKANAHLAKLLQEEKNKVHHLEKGLKEARLTAEDYRLKIEKLRNKKWWQFWKI